MMNALPYVRLIVTIVAALSSENALPAEIEFEGRPAVRVTVIDGTIQRHEIPPAARDQFTVKIVKDGEQYFWATRRNLPLVKNTSGAYVTYTAANGAGYVRLLAPEMRHLLGRLPPDKSEAEYVYMEHLANMMGSVTYFGR